MADPGYLARLAARIKAYHGSPHDFDKFDLSKIGTGEGNQSFGHGLYVAENEDVARMYRDSVIDTKWFDGTNRRLSELAREMHKYAVPGTSREFRDKRGYLAATEYDALMDARANKKGRMYEVALPDTDRWMNWDRPFSDQSPDVRRILESLDVPAEARFQVKHGYLTGAPDVERMDGDTIYGILRERAYQGGKKQDAAAASRELSEAGIPGIKYRDAGSRATREGGSHNYSVFDPDLIEILRKYAQGGYVRGPEGYLSRVAA